MRPLSFNFITIHYAYILLCVLLAFTILAPEGNVKPIDAFFFAVSGNTESGLNTFDVKVLKLYQQLVIYFFPIITNLGIINIIVVLVRLRYFEKHMKAKYPSIYRGRFGSLPLSSRTVTANRIEEGGGTPSLTTTALTSDPQDDSKDEEANGVASPKAGKVSVRRPTTSITWAKDTDRPPHDMTLKIPSPRERERGVPISEVTNREYAEADDGDSIELASLEKTPSNPRGRFPRSESRSSAQTGRAIERAVSSAFVLGGEPSASRRSVSRQRRPSANSAGLERLPQLSDQVTIGRNSNFYNLTTRDREELGGVEYRSLKLLLKIVTCYYFGLHIFGALCLAPWIVNAPHKYRDVLAKIGQGEVWWAFYSTQTMINNLGFTLTPRSMIPFQDATWPLLVMSFLAFAGNTCYPVFLRCTIWTMHLLTGILEKQYENERRKSWLKTTQQSLRFLLDHPRRCYTMLFPSNVTWILFGVLFLLNFADVLIIICCDLHNNEVNHLWIGNRIVAAIFQAANSRHTGATTFNLANVSPAVQFSLLVMMYVAVFPIAISVRASNTYEERSLGTYAEEPEAVDGISSATYIKNHARNQLSFDLWYIFLGAFCICIAEATPIMNNDTKKAVNVFAILFEVVSGYANVGLSLGTDNTNTSLAGELSTFSKLVLCAMMIRGRHRGLPYALDRSVMLPGERLEREEMAQESRASRDWESNEGMDNRDSTFRRVKTN